MLFKKIRRNWYSKICIPKAKKKKNLLKTNKILLNFYPTI